jgi:hypothetical protein
MMMRPPEILAGAFFAGFRAFFAFGAILKVNRTGTGRRI